MAVYRTYECPSCSKCFDFLHHPNDEPPPDFCPLCGANVSGKKRAKKVDRIRSPAKPISSGGRPGLASKSADGLYRQMENASQDRMQDAADLLGIDKRQLASMKMTNMKDNMRAGDVSYMPSAATAITGGVTAVDGVQVGQMSFQNNAEAHEFARNASVGPNASVGKNFRNSVVSNHQAKAAQMVQAGTMGKY